MSTRTFGILASVIGSVAGAWWWKRQRSGRNAAEGQTPGRDHGTVIYDNTPKPVEADVI